MSSSWILGLASSAGLLGLASVLAGGSRDAGGDALKAVVHVNFGDAERQKKGLKNIRNILKDEPAAEIAVVAHGAGLALLLKSDSPAADEVQALAGEGVKFLACENTMREKSIPRESLLSAVETVPSGAVEVIWRQQQGAGYFRP